jgi:hypothetical protein
MTEPSHRTLSVNTLFAEREERRHRDQQAAEQLYHRKEEELASFKKRLDVFQLTDATIASCINNIKHAFEHGETELMITSFPSEFCADGGRAIINAGEPPINKPTKAQMAAQAEEPEWLSKLPTGVRKIYDYWKTNLKPGGFGFAARVINYPGGSQGTSACFSLGGRTRSYERNPRLG